MTTTVEYKFKTDEKAWEFARDRGIDTVIERYFRSGRVQYIVKITTPHSGN